MLTESELLQMTEVVRDRLENEELGVALGHHVKVVEAIMDTDGHDGKLLCECGWKSGRMYSCWFAEKVQKHLEEVVAERFDVAPGPTDSATSSPRRQRRPGKSE